MAKCRHPYSSQVKALPPCWVCLRCNARGVSSLGLADDRPSEVQIEIRAAEITASKTMDHWEVSEEEILGRMIARGYVASFNITAERLAGFLSAIIEEDETAALGWDWDPFKPIAGQYEEQKVAEQTRHDVAASVVRHAATEQPDAVTAWSKYAADNVKTVEKFEAGRAEIETDSVGNQLPNFAEWFAKQADEPPEETSRAHARIEAGIAKLEPGEGDPDWQAKVWSEIGGES